MANGHCDKKVLYVQQSVDVKGVAIDGAVDFAIDQDVSMPICVFFLHVKLSFSSYMPKQKPNEHQHIQCMEYLIFNFPHIYWYVHRFVRVTNRKHVFYFTITAHSRREASCVLGTKNTRSCNVRPVPLTRRRRYVPGVCHVYTVPGAYGGALV